MKLIVTTSNNYMHLLQPFAYFFNKYWFERQEVIILCYDKPNFKLPENFEIVSLGNQQDYGNAWTTALIPFFKSFKDEYFSFILEDFFISNTVNKNLFKLAEEKITTNQADKVFFNFLNNNDYLSHKIDENFYLMKPNSRYRTSVHPFIMKTEYFLKYLIPGRTIWQYELVGMEEAKNDNHTILIPSSDILYCINAKETGVDNINKCVGDLKKEDIEYLKKNNWLNL